MYTPELERRVVWRVVDLAQGIIISSYEYIVAATTTEQSSHNKQQANHDHHDSQNTDEDEAATAAAAVVVAARAPSLQANERRMAKKTGGNDYREQGKYKHFLFRFTAMTGVHSDQDLYFV